MSRYIDADARDNTSTSKVIPPTYKPTADVVEVVRCKDCKYYSHIQMGSNPGVCAVNILAYTATEPENYCGYGERKILPKDRKKGE